MWTLHSTLAIYQCGKSYTVFQFVFLYIPLWLYINHKHHAGQLRLTAFTFHFGYISIRPFGRLGFRRFGFTFHFGYISIIVGLICSINCSSLHSTLAIYQCGGNPQNVLKQLTLHSTLAIYQSIKKLNATTEKVTLHSTLAIYQYFAPLTNASLIHTLHSTLAIYQ